MRRRRGRWLLMGLVLVGLLGTSMTVAGMALGGQGGGGGGDKGNQGDGKDESEDRGRKGEGGGGGNATGQPGDGEVGNADDKDPPGQDRGDSNAGYECDRNQGVGKDNPAHTGNCGGDNGDGGGGGGSNNANNNDNNNDNDNGEGRGIAGAGTPGVPGSPGEPGAGRNPEDVAQTSPGQQGSVPTAAASGRTLPVTGAQSWLLGTMGVGGMLFGLIGYRATRGRSIR